MFGPVMGTLPPEGDLQSMYELSLSLTHNWGIRAIDENGHDHTHTHDSERTYLSYSISSNMISFVNGVTLLSS